MPSSLPIIVLHGTFRVTEEGNYFLFWGESSKKITERGNFHPFSLGPGELARIVKQIMPNGTQSMKLKNLSAYFPAFGNMPLASMQMAGIIPDDSVDSANSDLLMKDFTVPSVTTSVGDAFASLFSINEFNARKVIVGDDLKFWENATRFAYNILSEQKFLPTVMVEGASVRSRWAPMLETYEDQSLLENLAKDMPMSCLIFNYGQIDSRTLLRTFINTTVDQFCRSMTNKPSIPRDGGDILKWVDSLSSENSLITYGRSLAIQKISSWSKMIEDRLEFPLRMSFDLVPPENNTDPWTLRFLVQSKNDPSLIIPFDRIWKHSDKDAMSVIRKFTDFPEEFLLQSLGVAQMIFPPIKRALQSAYPSEVQLNSEDVYNFLKNYSTVLGESGFSILFPEWWTKKNRNLGLKINARPVSGSKNAKLGVEALVNYSLDIVSDGETISAEELERLSNLKSHLVHIGKKWVEVDPDQLKKLLKMIKDGSKNVPLLQLLSLTAENDMPPVVEISAKGWLKNFFSEKQNFSAIDEPEGFSGKLRAYQKQGLSWLNFMTNVGFGSCLADDMGLGKTVEIISLLLKRAEGKKDRGTTLVLSPTSVISNWLHEFNRFAPSLKVLAHHGALRSKGDNFIDVVVNYDVIVTSYSLLQRDFDFLSKIMWDGIIADEAQYIKNAGTKQSKAIRSLKGNFRIAMTGTPIENRLDDLRSIFEFINPGYLGGEKKFKSIFSNPIMKDEDSDALDKLGRLVNPFILRRVKTDKRIISDLPEKDEMKLYVSVSAEQASLYEATVKAMLEDIEDKQGIQKKGIILSTITKLKRIIDHPSLVSGDKDFSPERSEKLVRLLEMLYETLKNGEKTLIFTQYVEAGRIIKEAILNRFNEEAMFLTGSTPRMIREQMIERFQDPYGPKIFILSVKAGGFGINLTAATNVIHFDRWWNPAVENQATDRAYRIGQTKMVHVYKFISTGTIEEKVDDIIEGKNYLSKAIIKSTDESWITNLSSKELRGIFALRKETIAEVGD